MMYVRKSTLLGLLGVLSFSLTLPMTRIALQGLSPDQIAIWRSIVAGLVAGAVLLALRPQRPRGRQFIPLIGCSLGTVFGFPFFISLAMQTVPASQGAIVVGLLPISTAVFGVLIGRERVTNLFWVYSVVGMTLTLVFVIWRNGAEFGVGNLYLLMAVVSAGFGYAAGGMLSRDIKAWIVACWSLIIALPILAVLASFMPPVPLSSSWPVLAAFSYLALASQLLGFFAWYGGLALGGIARISQLQLLQVFFTLGFSALLLSETIGINVAGFGLAVSLTVWLASKQKQTVATSKG